MLSADDETSHLAETLIFTLNVILEARPDDRQRIARAHSSAQALAASIPSEAGSVRSRIVACLEQFEVHKAAEEIEAAGWMLAAIQERIAEQNLPDWDRLQVIADKAVSLMQAPKQSVH